jgi:hypothetical protein
MICKPHRVPECQQCKKGNTMAGKCEHGLTTRECMVCASPKYGGEAVCMQETQHAELLAQLLDPNMPKSEREHAAVLEIERLRAQMWPDPPSGGPSGA